MFRPEEYADISLYDWIRLGVKYMVNKQSKATNVNEEDITPETDMKVDDLHEDSVNINTIPDIIKESPASCVSSRKKKTTQNMMDSLAYENQINSAYLCGSSWAVDTEGASFTSGHPQADTHAVHMKNADGFIIPNFVGGSLPHCDLDDREYYCCTVLTLFSPW